MNESTNEGLVMIEIPCEECINGSVERIGATMPVACLHCDGTGRVELYGDDATDELERREIAKRKAAERRATQPPATYPSARLTTEERAEAIRQSDAKLSAYQSDPSDANFRALVATPGLKFFVDAVKRARGPEVEDYAATVSEIAAVAAEGRSGSLARPASPAAWPFDVALEASRDNRARRTNAHPATAAAFGHLTAKPGRARQTSVGGWAK